MSPAANAQNSQNAKQKVKRTEFGTVVSDKRDKTRTVMIESQSMHPKYGKYLQRRAKYHVHDPANTSKAGDRVEITPCRPMSKHKGWRLVRVVEAAPQPARA